MNVMDIPKRIVPRYYTEAVDQIVPIYSGRLELLGDHGSYSADGKISFEWIPSPAVTWQMDGVGDTVHFISLGPVTLRVPGYSQDIRARVTSMNMSSHEPTRLSGIVENGEGRQTEERLSSVVFCLANFISFSGAPVRDESGTKVSADRAVLRGAGWKITIDGIWLGSTRKRELSEHFFLSHVGKLERENGDFFSSEEANAVLDKLYWFFSFCRGAPTPGILPVGFNAQGVEVWSEWGGWNVGRFEAKRNWYNDFSAEGLEKAFPGFWERMQSPEWKQPIRLSIYWYLESEKAGNDSAIILAQAAFELLSWSFYTANGKTSAVQSTFKSLTFCEKLSQLLVQLGIRLEIPGTLDVLTTTALAQGWNAGPDALVGIRNALVHPSPKNMDRYEVLSARSLFEASQLSLWYLEMILLWLFDYDGQYSNRLVITGWKGQEVEQLPWLQSVATKQLAI